MKILLFSAIAVVAFINANANATNGEKIAQRVAYVEVPQTIERDGNNNTALMSAAAYGDVDIVGGVTGRTDAPGVVIVELSRVFPGGISAAAQSALSSTIFHEFHHLERGWTIQGNKFGAGIPIAAVNEGLASMFSEEYTGVYFEESESYPEDAFKWLEEILSLPKDANYSTWMMGEHPDGRNYIGYRVGRYIVHQAMANSGKNIIELSKLSPDEILGIVAGR
jgi:hypothetical protein